MEIPTDIDAFVRRVEAGHPFFDRCKRLVRIMVFDK